MALSSEIHLRNGALSQKEELMWFMHHDFIFNVKGKLNDVSVILTRDTSDSIRYLKMHQPLLENTRNGAIMKGITQVFMMFL